MERFGEKEVAKWNFYAANKTITIWDVNVDNILVSKLVETKTNSNYVIEIRFDQAIRPLFLIMPKSSW